MALLEYKIVKFSHENRHVSAVVRVYRGSMQDVVVEDPNSFTIPKSTITVNRYVRAAKMLERAYEYDVPRDMTRAEFVEKVQAYLNKKLLDYATANGHTVVTPQQDISALEAVSNEQII